MNNSPSALQVLGAVWAFVVWLPRSSWSPRAPPDDTSGRFPFGVKGGLVIELSRGSFEPSLLRVRDGSPKTTSLPMSLSCPSVVANRGFWLGWAAICGYIEIGSSLYCSPPPYLVWRVLLFV